MIKTVLFDLDGTLVDTLGGIAGACNYVLKKHGHPTIKKEKYMDYVGNGLAMTMVRAMPIELQNKILEEQKVDTSVTIGEVKITHPTVKQYVQELIEYYKENALEDTFLYEGIKEVLDYLKENDILWGIHTNKTSNIAKDIANHFFDTYEFIGLSGPCDEIPKKPDPFGSKILLGDYIPDEVLFVGDTEVDVETAKNLGVACVAVSYGFRKKEVLEMLKPDFLIDQIEDLIGIIKDGSIT